MQFVGSGFIRSYSIPTLELCTHIFNSFVALSLLLSKSVSFNVGLLVMFVFIVKNDKKVILAIITSPKRQCDAE